MINILLSLILVFLVSLNNLYIFQLQYYEAKRFIKVKLQNINYYYLLFLPFAILSVYYDNPSFTLGSIILFAYLILLLDKKDQMSSLKFTFRIYRLITLILLVSLLILFNVNKLYLLRLFLLIIFNPLLILICNVIDLNYRVIINIIMKNKLKHKLKKINPLIIGITGSYGKTSTKRYLESILKLKYNVLTPKGNINTYKGVVNYLNKNLTPLTQVLIIEIGLDKKNGINKFLKLFKFDYSFLTGIEKCHLSTFKSIENIINEKMKLIKNSKLGFINIDNNYLKETEYNTYSLNDLDYLEYKNNIMSFKIKNINKEFKTSIVGDQHILNIIGVIKFLTIFKFDEELIYQGVIKLKNESHRYEIKKINELLIIDDAYNSNATSFRYAIDSLKYFNQKKVLITPGVIELGEENEITNYNLGLYIINYVDEVILIGLNSLSIEKAFIDNQYSNYQYFETFKEGFNYLKSKQDKDFITLIENDLPDYYLN